MGKSATVLVIFGICLVSQSEQRITTRSISAALVAALPENKNFSVASYEKSVSHPPRRPTAPQDGNGSSRLRPLVTTSAASFENEWWTSTRSSTTTPPPTTQGWTSVSPSSTVTPTSAATPVGWLKCPESASEDYPVHLPHPFHCSYFYQCSHGRAYRQRCREGLHFNAYFSVCDWPQKAKCPYQLKDGFLDN